MISSAIFYWPIALTRFPPPLYSTCTTVDVSLAIPTLHCTCTTADVATPPTLQLHSTLNVEFGTRYTKTSCIVYRIYQYIHDPKNLIHDTYTIILGLQFSIIVQQNFISFSQNFAKFSQIFLKLS